MTRAEAIHGVLSKLTDELVVICNGYPSREAFGFRDRPEHFYMIGSMGLAPAIGVGIALAKPTRTVVVLDGDGNVLMNMGTLATIAAHHPTNLLHIVFDNEVYGSTGDQATFSNMVSLDVVAQSCGYASVNRVVERDTLLETVEQMLTGQGPGFLLVKVSTQIDNVPRVDVKPDAMTKRFMMAANGMLP